MPHFVSAACGGEFCDMCVELDQDAHHATHKVGEEIPHDDPNPVRHNLTTYVCCQHFRLIMGNAVPCD